MALAIQSDKVMFEIYRDAEFGRRYHVVYFTELDEHTKDKEINDAMRGEHVFDGYLRNYTKQEILEMYLSVAYFGRSAYGIASASQIYFGKIPSDLTLPESSLLIGMLKGPGTFDPLKHLERSINRRNTVLDQMVKYDYLTKEKEQEAKDDEIEFKPIDEELRAGLAPHFVEWIRQQLLQKAAKLDHAWLAVAFQQFARAFRHVQLRRSALSASIIASSYTRSFPIALANCATGANSRPVVAQLI